MEKEIKKVNTIKIDLGNNEEISRGVFINNDGTYTAMTFTKSKDFKTITGAEKWMKKNTR